jgi:hypothetical protein
MWVKSTMVLVFLAGFGCAGPAAPAPRTARGPEPTRRPAAAAESTPTSPASSSLVDADRAYAAQLGSMRGGQLDVERQIIELQRAVLLYRQFLERAEGRPELLPAVRKARERIADATDTLRFLWAEPEPEPEPEP